MGHVRVYSISDAIARFYRMCGKKVRNLVKIFAKVYDSGHLLDVVAIHPFTDQKIPLYVTDDVTYPDGADAYPCRTPMFWANRGRTWT